jgi:hypothetical protein
VKVHLYLDKETHDAFESVPRGLSVSAYLRMIVKLIVWNEARLNREYKSNSEFRNCIENTVKLVDKIHR